jgi:phasin family protein
VPPAPWGFAGMKAWPGSEASMAAMNEFTKMFTEMKMPMMPDVQALMALQRRNIEVLSAANKVALEGAQTVARRHMEIMQQTMQEMSEAIRALSGSAAPKQKAATQTELLKQSYEHAVSNIKEISDLIQHANGEAIAMLNQRFSEAMDEMKSLLAKSAG